MLRCSDFTFRRRFFQLGVNSVPVGNQVQNWLRLSTSRDTTASTTFEWKISVSTVLITRSIEIDYDTPMTFNTICTSGPIAVVQLNIIHAGFRGGGTLTVRSTRRGNQKRSEGLIIPKKNWMSSFNDEVRLWRQIDVRDHLKFHATCSVSRITFRKADSLFPHPMHMGRSDVCLRQDSNRVGVHRSEICIMGSLRIFSFM